MVKTGSSYCSQSELPLTFGLGAADERHGDRDHVAERHGRTVAGRCRPIRRSPSQEGKGVVRTGAPVAKRSTMTLRALADRAVPSARLAALRRSARQQAARRATRDIEKAYRANNVGVAQLEQFDYDAAAAAFREALRDRTRSGHRAAQSRHRPLLRRQARGRARRGDVAARGAADSPQPATTSPGLIAKTDNRVDEAAAAFERVRSWTSTDAGREDSTRTDPNCKQREYAEAVALFQEALAARALQRHRRLQPRRSR